METKDGNLEPILLIVALLAAIIIVCATMIDYINLFYYSYRDINNLKKFPLEGSDNICQVKEICLQYQAKRNDCASSGNYDLCMSISINT